VPIFPELHRGIIRSMQQQQEEQRQAAVQPAQQQQMQASLSSLQNTAIPTVDGPAEAPRQNIGAVQANIQGGLSQASTGQSSASVQQQSSNVAQTSGRAALAMQQQLLQRAQLAAAVRLQQQKRIIQHSQQAQKQQKAAATSTPSTVTADTEQSPNQSSDSAVSRGNVSAGLQQQQRLMGEQAPGPLSFTLQQQQQQAALKKQLEFSAAMQAHIQQQQQRQQGQEVGQIQAQTSGTPPLGRQHHQQQKHVSSAGTSSPSVLSRQQREQKQYHQTLMQQAAQAPIMQVQTVQKQKHQQQQHGVQTEELKTTDATTVATSSALNQQQGQQATLQKAKQAVLQAKLLKAQSPGTEEEKKKESAGLSAANGAKGLFPSQNNGTAQATIAPGNAQEKRLVSASNPGTVSARHQSLGFLVNCCQWDEVFKRIQRDPSDFMIGENATVLHGAMAKSAWHVVEDLLALVPALATKPCVVLPSQPPLPPIYMAISFPAPAEAEEQAFSVYLDAILRIAVGNQQFLGMRDTEGYTPLHSSIASEHPARVSLVLLNAFPQAAQSVDATGYSPFHTLLTKICKSTKNVTKMDCQLMNQLLNIYPECVSMFVPAKKTDGTALPGVRESAEMILEKYSQTMTRHNNAAATKLILCHKAQAISLQHVQRGNVRVEKEATVAQVNKAPAPAKPSVQLEQTLERKKKKRDQLQRQYDGMKKVAMEQIEEMQRQGVDIRKAIQSVKNPEVSNRTENTSALEVAMEESRAKQYNTQLKDNLQKLLASKNEAGKQMFEELTRSREAQIKDQRENYRKQVSDVINKHKKDIINLRECTEKKKKDLEKHAASEIDLLKERCSAVEVCRHSLLSN